MSLPIINFKNMRSINNVFLMGNLAADPDLRQTKSGKAVATFPLATNRDWVDSEGEKKSQTDYHKVVLWRKLAETCAKYLGKGSLVHVSGRLTNRSYETDKGEKRYTTEIIADRVDFVRTKKAKDGTLEVETSDVPEAKA